MVKKHNYLIPSKHTAYPTHCPLTAEPFVGIGRLLLLAARAPVGTAAYRPVTLGAVALGGPERVQAKVADFQDEAGVDDTVGGLEVAVRVQHALVDVDHALGKRGREVGGDGVEGRLVGEGREEKEGRGEEKCG
jgi:hypothetical protein